jgi:hypothetical protein
MNNYYGGWGNRYRNPYYSTANNNNSNTGRTHIYGPRSNGTFGEPNTPSGLRNGSSRDRVITRDGSTTNNAPSNNDRIRRNEYNSRNDRAMPDNNRVNQQRYETVTEDDNTRPSATEGGRTRRNDYDRQNRTIDAQPRVQSENEGNNNRTQQRNYDRPQRVERENRPIDQQRSYEPQRQERQQRSYEPRNDAPRYEPRRESPSYNAPRSEPRQSAPSPSPSQNNGGSRSGGRSGSRN